MSGTVHQGDADGRCPECGAPLRPGSTCRDDFHALLLLEAEVPGGPGNLAHFYAVATYGLQHPGSMGFTTATIEGLRDAIRDALAGKAGVDELRRRARDMSRSQGRVTRRGGEPVPDWGVAAWTERVSDVLAGGVDGYAERVEGWARAVIHDIDAAESSGGRRA